VPKSLEARDVARAAARPEPFRLQSGLMRHLWLKRKELARGEALRSARAAVKAWRLMILRFPLTFLPAPGRSATKLPQNTRTRARGADAVMLSSLSLLSLLRLLKAYRRCQGGPSLRSSETEERHLKPGAKLLVRTALLCVDMECLTSSVEAVAGPAERFVFLWSPLGGDKKKSTLQRAGRSFAAAATFRPDTLARSVGGTAFSNPVNAHLVRLAFSLLEDLCKNPGDSSLLHVRQMARQ